MIGSNGSDPVWTAVMLNISKKKRVEELYNQKHRVVLPAQHLVVNGMGGKWHGKIMMSLMLNSAVDFEHVCIVRECLELQRYSSVALIPLSI